VGSAGDLRSPLAEQSRSGLLLEAGGGVSIVEREATTLAEVWLRWLENEPARLAAGEAASQVVRSGLGGAAKNAELVEAAL
jgi:hypothetical protein